MHAFTDVTSYPQNYNSRFRQLGQVFSRSAIGVMASANGGIDGKSLRKSFIHLSLVLMPVLNILFQYNHVCLQLYKQCSILLILCVHVNNVIHKLCISATNACFSSCAEGWRHSPYLINRSFASSAISFHSWITEGVNNSQSLCVLIKISCRKHPDLLASSLLASFFLHSSYTHSV